MLGVMLCGLRFGVSVETGLLRWGRGEGLGGGVEPEFQEDDSGGWGPDSTSATS